MEKTDEARNIFVSKIKDLDSEDVQYTEDFFVKAFGNMPTTTIVTDSASVEIPHQTDPDESWLSAEQTSYDGQLAVDVFEDGDAIIMMSAVAGVRAEDLDVAMNGDMITIKGVRRQTKAPETDDHYFIRECFWGGFSRSIILPVDIAHEHVRASLEQGVLTITIPKATRSRNTKIAIEEPDIS